MRRAFQVATMILALACIASAQPPEPRLADSIPMRPPPMAASLLRPSWLNG